MNSKIRTSELTSTLEESKILNFSRKIEKMINKGIKIYRFDIGDPDFKTPDKIIETAYQYMKKGYTHYGPPAGIKELREEIASLYNEKIDNVIITPGSKQAIYYALCSILEPNDEVIIILPGWLEYLGQIHLCRAKPCFVSSDEEFNPNIDLLRRRINEKTKAIIINSPNNPTGIVYDRKILKEIADIALENNVYVISDEIYSNLVYEKEFVSIKEFMKLEDGLIITNGFSKTFAMTGWRLGYALADDKIINQMKKVQIHTVVTPSTFAQYAAITALRECKKDVQEMVNEYNRRRKVIIDALNEISFEFVEPNGAFYFFLDTKKYLKNTVNVPEYVLKNAKASVIDGENFGSEYKSFIRIAYTTSTQDVKEGIQNIVKLLKIS
jgi:Aspartate/tyrosine/aromatic aminotransferase